MVDNKLKATLESNFMSRLVVIRVGKIRFLIDREDIEAGVEAFVGQVYKRGLVKVT